MEGGSGKDAGVDRLQAQVHEYLSLEEKQLLSSDRGKG